MTIVYEMMITWHSEVRLHLYLMQCAKFEIVAHMRARKFCGESQFEEKNNKVEMKKVLFRKDV